MPAEDQAPSPGQPGTSEPGPTAQATTVTAGPAGLCYTAGRWRSGGSGGTSWWETRPNF